MMGISCSHLRWNCDPSLKSLGLLVTEKLTDQNATGVTEFPKFSKSLDEDQCQIWFTAFSFPYLDTNVQIQVP